MGSGVKHARGFFTFLMQNESLRQCRLCRGISTRIAKSGRVICNRKIITNSRHSLGQNLSHTFVSRSICTRSTQSADRRLNTTEPYDLVKEELDTLCCDIKQELKTSCRELRDASHYHFDGLGKSFRPMVVMLMAKACNLHTSSQESLLPHQRTVAMIAEMIHTASLVHDDVIDASAMRRGKPSVHNAWGQRTAILTGDYIMSASSIALARIRNNQVVQVLSKVLEDLVKGEFMQLGSNEDEADRFNHYMRKTYKKTASLLANSCLAVSILGKCSQKVQDIAFQYGRNIGIAFQLVDDLLDFTSSDSMMGKPTAADLQLGLATAPVLFAAEEHPELVPMIMRRFSEEGDVETARDLVAKSDGVSHTRFLATQHSKEAIHQVEQLASSPERDALITLTHRVINRLK